MALRRKGGEGKGGSGGCGGGGGGGGGVAFVVAGGVGDGASASGVASCSHRLQGNIGAGGEGVWNVSSKVGCTYRCLR